MCHDTTTSIVGEIAFDASRSGRDRFTPPRSVRIRYRFHGSHYQRATEKLLHGCFLFFINLSTGCIGSETWLCLTNHVHAALQHDVTSELTDSADSFFRKLSTPRRSRVEAISNAPLKRVKICAANSFRHWLMFAFLSERREKLFWFVE